MKKYFLGGILLIMAFVSYSFYSPSVCFGSGCGEELTNEKMENLENLSDPKTIQEELNAGKIVLIDVREKSEWDAGHIAGASHIALGDLNAETTKDLPKDIPIYLYCRSGARAGTAEEIMRGLGFSDVKNLGGIIDWQENGGVLVK